jgi:hypothetical protein
MTIESVSLNNVSFTAASAATPQRVDRDRPRAPGESYAHYIHRLSPEGFRAERNRQVTAYKALKLRWDDYGYDVPPNKRSPAYPIYLKLRALDAEGRTRARAQYGMPAPRR